MHPHGMQAHPMAGPSGQGHPHTQHMQFQQPHPLHQQPHPAQQHHPHHMQSTSQQQPNIHPSHSQVAISNSNLAMQQHPTQTMVRWWRSNLLAAPCVPAVVVECTTTALFMTLGLVAFCMDCFDLVMGCYDCRKQGLISLLSILQVRSPRQGRALRKARRMQATSTMVCSWSLRVLWWQLLEETREWASIALLWVRTYINVICRFSFCIPYKLHTHTRDWVLFVINARKPTSWFRTDDLWNATYSISYAMSVNDDAFCIGTWSMPLVYHTLITASLECPWFFSGSALHADGPDNSLFSHLPRNFSLTDLSLELSHQLNDGECFALWEHLLWRAGVGMPWDDLESFCHNCTLLRISGTQITMKISCTPLSYASGECTVLESMFVPFTNTWTQREHDIWMWVQHRANPRSPCSSVLD